MERTLVLTLDADNVAFLEHLADEYFQDDPETVINQLLRKERRRLNLLKRPSNHDFIDQLIDEFAHQQIPAAG